MSLRKAINDKCKDCIHDPLAAGTWRTQVSLCSCTDCPLWPVRPRLMKRGSVSSRSIAYYGVKPGDPQEEDLKRHDIGINWPTEEQRMAQNEGIQGEV